MMQLLCSGQQQTTSACSVVLLDAGCWMLDAPRGLAILPPSLEKADVRPVTCAILSFVSAIAYFSLPIVWAAPWMFMGETWLLAELYSTAQYRPPNYLCIIYKQSSTMLGHGTICNSIGLHWHILLGLLVRSDRGNGRLAASLVMRAPPVSDTP